MTRWTALIIFSTLLAACERPLSPTATVVNSSSIAVGKVPGSVETADLNGDKKVDIIVANSESSDVTVLLGDGSGGFKSAPGSPFTVGQLPNDIGIGDFNGDQKLDLAFPNHEQHQITLLLGDGNGGFTPGPKVAVQSKPHAHGITANDFNGDKHLDLVIESWQTNQVELLLGNGKASFATPGPLFAVGRMPYQRLRSGDFNKDGYADIVTTNLEGHNVTILLGSANNGLKEMTGSPFPAGRTPFGVAVNDMNKDGNLDLVVANYSGEPSDQKYDGVTVLLGDGRGSFKMVPGSPFKTGAAPTRVAIGDVNGDGFLDIAASNSESNDITVLLGDDKISFVRSYQVKVGREPKGIAIADLNGDGKGDIVVANAQDNNISVLISK